MKQNYNDCLLRVLKEEGGYSNVPGDNGGPTNFGITIIDYRKYINKNGTAADVKNMTVDQAKTIYKTKYWDAIDGDNLPSGVDHTCFDYGVNSGNGRPKKDLVEFKDLSGDKLIDAINDERMAFLRAIGVGHNAQFLKGWTARVNRVRLHSHELAAKKDVVSGPSSGVASSLGLWATLSQYFHNHPYIIASASVAVGITIWAIVHYFRNKK